MELQVELFGIARRRVGTPTVVLQFPGASCRLQDVIEQLTDQHPALLPEAGTSNQQLTTLIACIDGAQGDRFVRRLDSEIRMGERLLLMSSDVGG